MFLITFQNHFLIKKSFFIQKNKLIKILLKKWC